jgi:hypothetical protein
MRTVLPRFRYGLFRLAAYGEDRQAGRCGQFSEACPPHARLLGMRRGIQHVTQHGEIRLEGTGRLDIRFIMRRDADQAGNLVPVVERGAGG